MMSVMTSPVSACSFDLLRQRPDKGRFFRCRVFALKVLFCDVYGPFMSGLYGRYDHELSFLRVFVTPGKLLFRT
jgi:hypothetical protein